MLQLIKSRKGKRNS